MTEVSDPTEPHEASPSSWVDRTSQNIGKRLAGSAFNDSTLMPPRLLEQRHPGSKYSDFLVNKHDKSFPPELASIFNDTRNPAEYFTLFRMQHGGTSQELGINPNVMHAVEFGKAPPSRRMMAALRESIGARYPAEMDRLEDLTIAYRLKLAKSRFDTRNETPGNTPGFELAKFNRSIAKILREMPPRYWETLLDQFHDEAGFLAQPHKPEWMNALMPMTIRVDGNPAERTSPFAIQYREDYLRTIRNILRLEPGTVAKAIGCSTATVLSFENSYSNPNSQLGNQLADFYAATLAIDKAKGTLADTIRFDRERYDGLELGYDSAIAAERDRDRYATRVADAKREAQGLIDRS